MNISVRITPNAQLTALLRGSRMIAGYSVMRRAGQAVTDYLRAYHSKMDWKGSGWIPPSLGFATEVVKGWQNPVISGNVVTVSNTFGLLKWKVTGGEIHPVRASLLAWPLVSEAKGKSVAEYRASSGVPLFRAGMALCEKQGDRLRAVYALSKGVKQFPWPDAMPTDEALGLIFTTAVNQELARQLGTKLAA
jgi:hypothetical protein